MLALQNDSTPIGKLNFLKYYSRAQIDALTALNYKQGWAASGLWPVRMSKPLMNRLLLENSNKLADPTPATLGNILVPEWNEDRSCIVWKTPQKGKDIQDQARQITELRTIDLPTARVLFRKVAKGIDEKDFIITQQELRIKQLENRIVQLEPRKRRKVKASPNSRFINIEHIIRAQIADGERENVLLDSDDTTTIAFTLSHITINE